MLCLAFWLTCTFQETYQFRVSDTSFTSLEPLSKSHVQLGKGSMKRRSINDGPFVTHLHLTKADLVFRVLTLYQRISDLLHTKQPASGQGRQPAKLVFFQTEHEGVLGWVGHVFHSLSHLTGLTVCCRSRTRSKFISLLGPCCPRQPLSQRLMECCAGYSRKRQSSFWYQLLLSDVESII